MQPVRRRLDTRIVERHHRARATFSPVFRIGDGNASSRRGPLTHDIDSCRYVDFATGSAADKAQHIDFRLSRFPWKQKRSTVRQEHVTRSDFKHRMESSQIQFNVHVGFRTSENEVLCPFRLRCKLRVAARSIRAPTRLQCARFSNLHH